MGTLPPEDTGTNAWEQLPTGHAGYEEMRFVVTLDRDEDAVWIAECPSIPGCVSQGLSKEEALENVKEAIQLCLEVRAERGLPLTIETKRIGVTA